MAGLKVDHEAAQTAALKVVTWDHGSVDYSVAATADLRATSKVGYSAAWTAASMVLL